MDTSFDRNQMAKEILNGNINSIPLIKSPPFIPPSPISIKPMVKSAQPTYKPMGDNMPLIENTRQPINTFPLEKKGTMRYKLKKEKEDKKKKKKKKKTLKKPASATAIQKKSNIVIAKEEKQWTPKIEGMNGQYRMKSHHEYDKGDYWFSTDWFSSNIKHWMRLFKMFDLDNLNKKVKCLEVGSWEGRSSVFIVKTLLNHPESKLYCNDTFVGSIENAGVNANELYNTFMHNIQTSGKSNQVVVLRGSSHILVPQLFIEEHLGTFDFIYVDGSHAAYDVLLDAMNCFKLLKIGGLLIFDDYTWDKYPDEFHRPKLGIDAFISFMKHHIKVVHKGYQLAFEKISNPNP
jgi:predicted O-methyltransferase YrrM